MASEAFWFPIPQFRWPPSPNPPQFRRPLPSPSRARAGFPLFESRAILPGMTQYLNKTFSVAPGLSAAYRDNYDAVFGPKEASLPSTDEEPLSPLLALLQKADSELSSRWTADGEALAFEGPGYALRVVPGSSGFDVYLESAVTPGMKMVISGQRVETSLQSLEDLHTEVVRILDRWIVGATDAADLGGAGRGWGKKLRLGLVTLAFQVGDDLLQCLPAPSAGQPSPEARLAEPLAP